MHPQCTRSATWQVRHAVTSDVVATWTGRHADALRQALRMTNERFAAHLGVAARTVANWRARPDVVPMPGTQEILDAALARAPEPTKKQFQLLLAADERSEPTPAVSTASVPAAPSAVDELVGLTAWITGTNASDEAVDHLARSTTTLADLHTQIPPRQVLGDVLRLHEQTRTLLRSGKQRLRQTRDLIKIDGDLLAHASVLFSDLNRNRTAERYGNAALLFLQEAEANPAIAWYVLAKVARWEHRYAESADLAARGAEYRPANATTLQLACYEANAAALHGDITRARRALAHADKIAESLPRRSGRLAVGMVVPDGAASDLQPLSGTTGTRPHRRSRRGSHCRCGMGCRRPAHSEYVGADPGGSCHRPAHARLTRRGHRGSHAGAGAPS